MYGILWNSTSARSSTGNLDCLISSSFQPVAVSFSSLFLKAYAEQLHDTPAVKNAVRTISTKNAAKNSAKHRICWKKPHGPPFGLHPVFECGILFLLWKSSGAVCRAQQRGKGNER